MQEPREEYMEAACEVVRYLKGSVGYDILLPTENNLQLVDYLYSDWGACPFTKKSLTGYFVTLGGLLVHGRPKSKSLSLVRQPKPDILPWLLQQVN